MIDVEKIRARFNSEFDGECTLSVAEAERLLAVYEAAEKWARYGRDDGDDEHELLMAINAAQKGGGVERDDREGTYCPEHASSPG